MKRLLVFITRNYPHEKGEPFIENEISLLHEKFDKILLVSSLTATTPKQTRSTPDGVRVEYNAKPSYIPTILKNLPKASFWKNMIGEIKEQPRILSNVRSFAKCTLFSSIPDEAVADVWRKIKDVNYQEYDEVIIYSYWFHFTAAISIKLKGLMNHDNVKIISRAHRYDLYEYAEKDQYIPFRKYLLNNTDMIFSISEDGQTYLQNKYGKYREKIYCSRLGVPDRGQNPGETSETLHIVSCSRLEDLKRVHLIVEILSHFKTKKIKWTHFGDGSLFEETKNKAKKLPKNIEWEFKGNILNEQLMSFYRENHVDLFINVSSSEGIPVSIMEAQSFGIPVIATNVGGTGEIVHNGVNGFLLDQDFEIETVVQHIHTIINMSEAEYGELRKNSRELWEKDYNSFENYKGFIRSIV